MEGSIDFVEDLYRRFLDDPSSVSEDWAEYFASFNGVERRAIATPVVDRIAVLRSIGLFETSPQEELETVARISEELVLHDEEVIFNQGDAGRELYVVLGGTVLIRRS